MHVDKALFVSGKLLQLNYHMANESSTLRVHQPLDNSVSSDKYSGYGCKVLL